MKWSSNVSRPVGLAVLRKVRAVVFDFDGVFTDNRVIVSEDGRESVVCSRSDGYGLDRLRELGIHMMILSGEVNPVVSVRARKMKLLCRQGVEDKIGELKAAAAAWKVPLNGVAYVGNDINDIGCMKMVGLPVAVADAWPEVLFLARWVLARQGGQGAVREFCDTLWRAKEGKGRV